MFLIKYRAKFIYNDNQKGKHKMKIQQINNTHATIITKSNGDTVLVSYSTPVAACIDGKFYKTNTFYSVTTSRHINKFLDGYKAEIKEPSFFDGLL